MGRSPRSPRKRRTIRFSRRRKEEPGLPVIRPRPYRHAVDADGSERHILEIPPFGTAIQHANVLPGGIPRPALSMIRRFVVVSGRSVARTHHDAVVVFVAIEQPRIGNDGSGGEDTL